MWFPVHQVDILLRTKNVNNERICREVDGIVIDMLKTDINSLKTVSGQVMMVELIELALSEFSDTESSLSSFEVICDTRNNTRETTESGLVNLTVQYQQQHCLNVTELAYEIKP